MIDFLENYNTAFYDWIDYIKLWFPFIFSVSIIGGVIITIISEWRRKK